MPSAPICAEAGAASLLANPTDSARDVFREHQVTDLRQPLQKYRHGCRVPAARSAQFSNLLKADEARCREVGQETSRAIPAPQPTSPGHPTRPGRRPR